MLTLLTDISMPAKLLKHRLGLHFSTLPRLPQGPQQNISSPQLCGPYPHFQSSSCIFPSTWAFKGNQPQLLKPLSPSVPTLDTCHQQIGERQRGMDLDFHWWGRGESFSGMFTPWVITIIKNSNLPMNSKCEQLFELIKQCLLLCNE